MGDFSCSINSNCFLSSRTRSRRIPPPRRDSVPTKTTREGTSHSGFTSVFRPTLINDFRFGYTYYFGTKEGQNIHSGFLESLGITRAPGATNDGIPAIDVPGYADMGDSDIFQPQIRKDNTFQFTDNVAWVSGRHTWKFGADVRRYRLFYLVEDFGQGLFSFSDGASSVSGTAILGFSARPTFPFLRPGGKLRRKRSPGLFRRLLFR